MSNPCENQDKIERAIQLGKSAHNRIDDVHEEVRANHNEIKELLQDNRELLTEVKNIKLSVQTNEEKHEENAKEIEQIKLQKGNRAITVLIGIATSSILGVMAWVLTKILTVVNNL